jgi:hypothetical protein
MLGGARLACLSPIPIAVGSGRINRSYAQLHNPAFDCRVLLCLFMVRFRTFAFLLFTGFGGRTIPQTSKPISDLTEQLVKSTCVSPQLEANTRIPERQTPLRLGLSRRHVDNCGAAELADFTQKLYQPI